MAEDEMMFILTCEEMYWKQRGQQRWVLKGDASTDYFHAVANGCRRRCTIRCLREGDRTFVGEEELRAHIDGFYRHLLGSTSGGAAAMGPNMWGPEGRVSALDNLDLVCPFSFSEITSNLKAMKGDTAPGPDGFPVSFYKKFWNLVGPQFYQLVHDFTRGLIDVKRLNYGVLALVGDITPGYDPPIQGRVNRAATYKRLGQVGRGFPEDSPRRLSRPLMGRLTAHRLRPTCEPPYELSLLRGQVTDLGTDHVPARTLMYTPGLNLYIKGSPGIDRITYNLSSTRLVKRTLVIEIIINTSEAGRRLLPLSRGAEPG